MFRPGWPVTVATVIAFIILVSLGTWQLDRLRWKEALIDDIETALAAPPQTLGDVEPAVFVKVQIIVETVADGHLRYGSGAVDGELTSDVLKAVKGSDERWWLVNQGAFRLDVEPTAFEVGSSLTGIMRQPVEAGLFTPDNEPQNRLFYSHDMAAISTFFDRPLEPWIIDMELFESPPDIPNNHFVYALTWYGIAAGLLGVYIAFGWRQSERKA